MRNVTMVANLIVMLCCSESVSDAQSNSTFVVNSPCGGYECVFNLDTNDAYVVTGIYLRDTSNGNIERYKPQDEVSLRSSLGYFTNIWASSGKYLLLPAGRFEGFNIINVDSNLLSNIRKSAWNNLRIFTKSGVANNSSEVCLYHTFGHWLNGDEFSFSAGLSGSYINFTYDVQQRKLLCSSNDSNVLWFQNNNAEQRVSPSPSTNSVKQAEKKSMNDQR